ncbi:hypothetical protein ACFL2D_03115 [Patescibacteria group bacterium]
MPEKAKKSDIIFVTVVTLLVVVGAFFVVVDFANLSQAADPSLSTDLDGDGEVGLGDVFEFRKYIGNIGGIANFHNDPGGHIDARDFAILMLDWGRISEPKYIEAFHNADGKQLPINATLNNVEYSNGSIHLKQGETQGHYISRIFGDPDVDSRKYYGAVMYKQFVGTIELPLVFDEDDVLPINGQPRVVISFRACDAYDCSDAGWTGLPAGTYSYCEPHLGCEPNTIIANIPALAGMFSQFKIDMWAGTDGSSPKISKTRFLYDFCLGCDNDNDSYYSTHTPPLDCNDYDPNIGPDTIEQSNNKIDDDCDEEIDEPEDNNIVPQNSNNITAASDSGGCQPSITCPDGQKPDCDPIDDPENPGQRCQRCVCVPDIEYFHCCLEDSGACFSVSGDPNDYGDNCYSYNPGDGSSCKDACLQDCKPPEGKPCKPTSSGTISCCDVAQECWEGGCCTGHLCPSNEGKVCCPLDKSCDDCVQKDCPPHQSFCPGTESGCCPEGKTCYQNKSCVSFRCGPGSIECGKGFLPCCRSRNALFSGDTCACLYCNAEYNLIPGNFDCADRSVFSTCANGSGMCDSIGGCIKGKPRCAL